jgi:hypothetical protein
MPLADTVSVDVATSSVSEDMPNTPAVLLTPAISEKTHVGLEASPLPSRKRGRDDIETDMEASPAVRRVRPRTETYKPPLGRSLWNMVTKPIVSFIEGFKHGLKPDMEKLEPNIQSASEDASASNRNEA